ncbi:MAG: hypothetical protein AMXMBFR84_02860 [Candidatus Hydrogenedentota bacterium]
MPSWFSKVFKSEAEKPAPVAEAPKPAPVPPKPAAKSMRKVVHAPVIAEESGDQTAWTEEIRIKAKVQKGGATCLFLIDRPVLPGHSAWFPKKTDAKDSPLAETLFSLPEVESVLIHDMTVTIGRSPFAKDGWEAAMKEIGTHIRAHLQEQKPVVTEAFLAGLPPQEEIAAKLQGVIEREINPGVASHSGAIRLDRVEGNTVYIEMQGGCQGCAASDITLRQGIHESFRHAVPQIGAILDVTDHSAGKNPFFKQLPVGMERYA